MNDFRQKRENSIFVILTPAIIAATLKNNFIL